MDNVLTGEEFELIPVSCRPDRYQHIPGTSRKSRERENLLISDLRTTTQVNAQNSSNSNIPKKTNPIAVEIENCFHSY